LVHGAQIGGILGGSRDGCQGNNGGSASYGDCRLPRSRLQRPSPPAFGLKTSISVSWVFGHFVSLPPFPGLLGIIACQFFESDPAGEVVKNREAADVGALMAH